MNNNYTDLPYEARFIIAQTNVHKRYPNAKLAWDDLRASMPYERRYMDFRAHFFVWGAGQPSVIACYIINPMQILHYPAAHLSQFVFLDPELVFEELDKLYLWR